MPKEWIRIAAAAMPRRVLEEQIREAMPKIREGIAAMNEAMPGWFIQIDRDRLDLSDMQECVVGQVYQEWGLAPKGLIGLDEGRVRGFESSEKVGYVALTVAWDREIARLNRKYEGMGPHAVLAEIS